MTTRNTNAAMSASSLLTSAFKIGEQGEVNAAKSTQTMAAGVLAFYATLETDYRDRTQTFSAGIPAFSAFKVKGEARDEFKAVLIDAMTREGAIVARISAKEKKEDKKVTDALMDAANVKRNSQITKVELGMKLASALYAASISLANFDAKTGLFSVPVSAVLGGATPCYKLKTMADKGERVALDGTTYWYDTEERREKFRALPARVVTVAQEQGLIPVLVKAAKATANERKEQEGFDLVKEVKLITSKALQIDKIITEETMPFSDIDTDMINAFTEMQVAIDSWNAYLTKAKAMEGTKKAA